MDFQKRVQLSVLLLSIYYLMIVFSNKFIFPPYEFSIANSMITNFHMPKSTLLMMASAFIGNDFIKKAYEEAMKQKYNFYSYGDAMLII